jgi:hypothetical protein
MNSRFRFLWIRESFDPIGWRKMRLRTMERTAFKEVNLKFIIRRCHIGDETSLSLLGKAAFLETYAGSAEADNLRPLWKQSIQPGVTGPGSKATSPKSE